MLSYPVKPMLLQTCREPFDSLDYIFELKIDGIRCIMFYENGQVRLQSKAGKDCTNAFPELLSPKVKGNKAIFDGEITVLINGFPDFESVMERYLANRNKINSIQKIKPVTYYLWDVLSYENKQITTMPLLERKEILNDVIEVNNFIKKVDWVDSEGTVLWSTVQNYGLEGMVAKQKNSRYLPGRRSSAWLKIKNYQEISVNVFGYNKTDGVVLVGVNEKIQGHAIGINENDRHIMWELLDKYGETKGKTIWLPAGISGRVKFTTWSSKGNMRDCAWIGFEY